MNYKMLRIKAMTIIEFLNRKFLEWQLEEGKKKSIEDFAKLFGASQPLFSQWLGGKRPISETYKKRIIEKYGDEAIVAFGEDPDLYKVNANWEFMTPEASRTFREQSEKYRTENESKRTSETRRTRKTSQ